MSDGISQMYRESRELQEEYERDKKLSEKLSKNLKPCPFCGGEAWARVKDQYGCVSCTVCKASIEKDKLEEAVEAWNRRAGPRCWEKGSEPPDGWYVFKYMSGKTPRMAKIYVKNGIAYDEFSENPSKLKDRLHNAANLFGPINGVLPNLSIPLPEPEV